MDSPTEPAGGPAGEPTKEPDPPPLTGVAGLADRPVDGRRVALVMALSACLLAGLFAATIEHLLASANEEPEGGVMLRALATDAPAPAYAPSRVAVVLVDGMRVDEARRLPSLRALAPGSVIGEVQITTPTLSRPFYHRLFTGVSPDASGVRTNRFGGRARHDSVFDRVREAGGRVFVVADGLDWMRRMHTRAEDRVEDRSGALDGRLDAVIAAWREAPPPALLVVHPVRVDGTAHAAGIESPAHLAALAEADGVIARVAAVPDAALFVLSDHGHLARGGHGGPEPEVACAPLLVRADELAPSRLAARVPADELAATVAAWLGVPRPRSSAGVVPRALAPAGHPGDAEWSRHATRLSGSGEVASRLRLRARRRWTMLLALVFVVMTLGPIKRAFAFDRSVAVAVALWPLAAIGLHLALGRPLSLSAIDGLSTHGIRVGAIGLGAFALAFVLACALAPRRARAAGHRAQLVRRVSASIGWSACACAMLCVAWVGGALGPWPLAPRALYLSLFLSGASAATLVAGAVALLLSRGRPRSAD